MAVIGARKTWQVNNQRTRSNRGPLVRVKHPNGMVTKMYQQDAIEQGLLPGVKKAPAPEDKKAPAPANKGSLPPPPPEPPDDFTTITGVGPASAKALVANGVRTFAQLKAVDLDTLPLSRSVVTAIEVWRG